MGRDLMTVLDYDSWRNFRAVIDKAVGAGRSVGAATRNHFVETSNMVHIGSGAARSVEDWYLSRYACYLIAMNADSSKTPVAVAQTYFAVQTRRKEIDDQQKRLHLRLRLMENNHKLAGAAKKAGVKVYAFFQDAGYKGLYGMSLSSVERRKGLSNNQKLLDHAGRLELAANDFRITLTEHRLNRDSVSSEYEALRTHRVVGEEVRASVVRDNGIAPEDLPIEPSIKSLVDKHRRVSAKRTHIPLP